MPYVKVTTSESKYAYKEDYVLGPALIRAVADAVEQHPANYNQWVWRGGMHSAGTIARQVLSQHLVNEARGEGACETAMCLAGHATNINGLYSGVGERVKPLEYYAFKAAVTGKSIEVEVDSVVFMSDYQDLLGPAMGLSSNAAYELFAGHFKPPSTDVEKHRRLLVDPQAFGADDQEVADYVVEYAKEVASYLRRLAEFVEAFETMSDQTKKLLDLDDNWSLADVNRVLRIEKHQSQVLAGW